MTSDMIHPEVVSEGKTVTSIDRDMFNKWSKTEYEFATEHYNRCLS